MISMKSFNYVDQIRMFILADIALLIILDK